MRRAIIRVPKENHGKRIKQIFHGGPWDDRHISGWPRQVHSEYELPGGKYVRYTARDTATERHYRWVS